MFVQFKTNQTDIESVGQQDEKRAAYCPLEKPHIETDIVTVDMGKNSYQITVLLTKTTHEIVH